MFDGNEADHGDAGLGTRVRVAIRQAGINHSEVARGIGLEPSKLSKSLTGTRKFRIEEITRIAELTDVTTDWLTRGQGRSQPRRTIVTVPSGRLLTPADPVPSTSQDGGTRPPGPAVGAHDRGAADAGDHCGSDESPPAPDDETWMSKGTRNRRRIVASAWQLYADRGIDSVRVHDIAEASGLSISAISYHFRTKTQLLEAALRYSLELTAAARDRRAPDDPIGMLRSVARVHAGLDPTVRRVWSIWIQSWARALVDERSRLNLAAVYGEWLALISGILVAGQRAGHVRGGDINLMVKSLSIFIDGLGVARSTRQLSLADDEALTLVDSFLRTHILTPPQHRPPEDSR